MSIIAENNIIISVKINDPEISGLILRLSEHFTQNVATRFIRPYLTPIMSDSSIDRRISDLTDDPMDAADRGIDAADLYLQINAIAHFINNVRTSVLPSLSRSLGGSASDSQRVFRNMAISNFAPNVDLLEQYTKELFAAVIRYDKSHSKGKLLYEKIPENLQTAQFLHM